MELTPDELSGQAQGLASSGTMAMQGVGAVVAGVIAQRTSPATAMVTMAVISLAVTVILTPGLRPAARSPGAWQRAPDGTVNRTAARERER
jgi:membrane protein implicated in regulation of membrane protease activity